MEKSKSFWLNNRIKIIVAIGFGILFAIIFSKLNRNTFVSNDDTTFPEAVSQFATVWEYLSYRLATWSSRILPEIFTYIFSPISINYWRLASMIVYAGSVFFGYKLYKISSPDHNDKKDGIILATIMSGLLLMGLGVLDNYGAVYWVSGAMNYFWLTPFFLAGLYLPLYIFWNKKLPRPIWSVASIIAGFLVVISHEQFGVALVMILVYLAIFQFVKNKKFNNAEIWLVLILALMAAGFLIHFLTPGNSVRLQENIEFWLPDMYSQPFVVRLESDIRWLMDALINQTGYLLPIVWVLLSILLIKKPNKTLLDKTLTVILISAAFLGAFGDKFMVITIFLREFYPVWGFVGNKKDWIPIVFYCLILLLTLLAMWRVEKGESKRTSLVIVFSVIAATTIGAICLSPTMYASNYRTLYVASVLLIMVIVGLLSKLLNNPKSR